MTRTVHQTATERIEIEYTVQPLAPVSQGSAALSDDCEWEIHRRFVSHPINKAGAIQWRRGGDTDEVLCIVRQSEVADLVQELVDWMGYAMRGGAS